jgi:hypothetical protein
MFQEFAYEFLEFWTPTLMITIGFIVILLETVGGMRAAYGRYNKSNRGLAAPIAWLLQESPAFLIPLALTLYRGSFLFDKNNHINTNFILLCYFMLHYFNRLGHKLSTFGDKRLLHWFILKFLFK